MHIVSRQVSPAEAIRIAKVYLLKWHHEGQPRYEPLVRQQPHTDAVVRSCETWLQYQDPSFFRRLFTRRTGVAPVQYRRMFQPILHKLTPPSMVIKAGSAVSKSHSPQPRP